MRHLIFTFLSFFLLNGLVSANDYCNDLNAAVCQPLTNLQVEAQEKEFKRLKTLIKVKAESRAQERIEQLKVKGLFKGIRRYFKEQVITNEEIVKAAHDEITGFENNIVSSSLIKTIKDLIKEEVKKAKFNSKTKALMIAKVNKVKIFTFLEYMKFAQVTEKYIPSLFRAHCGMDGLSINAFAATIKKQPMVLICPGFIIYTNLFKNSSSFLSEATMVLSHEFSHHIDSAEFPEAYSELNACYAQNFGKDLYIKPHVKCHETSQPCYDAFNDKKEKVYNHCAKKRKKCRFGPCKTKEKSCRYFRLYFDRKRLKKCNEFKAGASCYARVAKSHLGEIIADTYSAKVMTALFKKYNFTPTDIINTFRDNISPLCGIDIDEGIHPTTAFRLNDIFGRQEGFNELLSCPSLETKPGCTF